jgi:MFS family permease
MTGTLSMMMLDSTVVSVALPSIQADLDLSQTELQWVVNAYLLALAAFVAVAGRISDMFNRVGVMIAGIAIFVVCSALCGLADSDAWLIGARALQGIGAALMIPPTATIVINTFAPDERGRAMGIYAGISMIFLSLGPLIGGVFTESLDWRWVFWINLPVGLVTIAMVLWTRPEGRVEAGQRLDRLGLVTLVPGLTLLVLGFMEASNWGWGSAKTIAALGAGAILLGAFALIEHRVASPLVQLRLFRVRNFSGDTAVLFFAQFALIGLTIFGAIFTQDLLGFTPIEAGLGMLPVTLPLLVAAPLAGRIYDRAGPRGIVAAGTLTAAIGFARHRRRARRARVLDARPGLRLDRRRHRRRDEPDQHRRDELGPAQAPRAGLRDDPDRSAGGRHDGNRPARHACRHCPERPPERSAARTWRVRGSRRGCRAHPRGGPRRAGGDHRGSVARAGAPGRRGVTGCHRRWHRRGVLGGRWGNAARRDRGLHDPASDGLRGGLRRARAGGRLSSLSQGSR